MARTTASYETETKVLHVLLNDQRYHTARHVRRVTGLSTSATQNALKELVRLGLADCVKGGNSNAPWRYAYSFT